MISFRKQIRPVVHLTFWVQLCMDCVSRQLLHGQFAFGHLSPVVNRDKTMLKGQCVWGLNRHCIIINFRISSITTENNFFNFKFIACNSFASSWHQFSHISSTSIVTCCIGKCHAQNALGFKNDRLQYLIHPTISKSLTTYVRLKPVLP